MSTAEAIVMYLADAAAAVVVATVALEGVESGNVTSVPFAIIGGHLCGTALASATSKPQHSTFSFLPKYLHVLPACFRTCNVLLLSLGLPARQL